MMLSKINKNLGITLFKNPNTLNYNLFNFFFKKNLVNFNDNKIKKYHELGFLKPNINSLKLSKYLSNKINNINIKKIEKNSNEYSTFFEIDDEMKEQIKFHLKNDYKDVIEKFKEYYGCDIVVANISLKRNYGMKQISHYKEFKTTKELEFYNNYFHCDYYTMNYFKLFINLQEITPEHGPLTFYSINDTKKFVKKSQYKDRNNYKKLDLESEIKNCGKIGDSLILNTPQCAHKASIPKFGNSRDVLFVNFLAVPEKVDNIFYYEKDFDNDLWRNGKNLVKKFAKPKNLRETYDLYKSFKKI